MQKSATIKDRPGWVYLTLLSGIILNIFAWVELFLQFLWSIREISVGLIFIGFCLLIIGIYKFPLPYKPVIFDVNNIFPLSEQYIFLVGAGISVNPPSNIPSAKEVIKTLIENFTLAEDTRRILNHRYLRYEHAIDLIQKTVDPNLRFMDFFSEFKTPNLIHYFLANAIKEGHDVISTNYDFLIEYALCHVVEDNNTILPIITSDDYKKYPNSGEIRTNQKLPLYKIHGATQDLIHHRDTKQSLVTTISALAKHRRIYDSFEIEYYKSETLKNLIKGRTLIVMGYSGNDSFDITPVLLKYSNFSKVIWINHTKSKVIKDSGDPIEVFRINPLASGSAKTDINDVDQLLINIGTSRTIWKKVPVYKINVDTITFVDRILWEHLMNKAAKPKIISRMSDKTRFLNWLQERFTKRKTYKKLELAFEFYKAFLEYDNALDCLLKRLKIAKKSGNTKILMYTYLALAEVYYLMGSSYYPSAKPYLIEILDSNLAKKDRNLFISCSSILATILMELKYYEEAFKVAKIALKYLTRTYEHRDFPTLFLIIGTYYLYFNDRKKAYEYFDHALESAVYQGRLEKKSEIMYRIGSQIVGQDRNSTIELLKEAIKIAEELNQHSLKYKCLSLLSSVHLFNLNLKGWIQRKVQAYRLEKQLMKLDPLGYQSNYDTLRIIIGFIIGVIIIEIIIFII